MNAFPLSSLGTPQALGTVNSTGLGLCHGQLTETACLSHQDQNSMIASYVYMFIDPAKLTK